MDTTELSKQWWQVRNDVQIALANAVKAHGGTYEFIDVEADNDDIDDWEEDAGLPLVYAEDSYDGFCLCYVTSVSADANGRLEVCGFTERDNDITYIKEFCDVTVPGYLQILEAIPEPCSQTKEH